jgi:hypothetical protein
MAVNHNERTMRDRVNVAFQRAAKGLSKNEPTSGGPIKLKATYFRGPSRWSRGHPNVEDVAHKPSQGSERISLPPEER